MLTNRIYRAGRPARQALAEVRRGSGTQFCPRCVTALEDAVGASALLDLGIGPRALAARTLRAPLLPALRLSRA